jgi:hypothetical protein
MIVAVILWVLKYLRILLKVGNLAQMRVTLKMIICGAFRLDIIRILEVTGFIVSTSH